MKCPQITPQPPPNECSDLMSSLGYSIQFIKPSGDYYNSSAAEFIVTKFVSTPCRTCRRKQFSFTSWREHLTVGSLRSTTTSTMMWNLAITAFLHQAPQYLATRITISCKTQIYTRMCRKKLYSFLSLASYLYLRFTISGLVHMSENRPVEDAVSAADPEDAGLCLSSSDLVSSSFVIPMTLSFCSCSRVLFLSPSVTRLLTWVCRLAKLSWRLTKLCHTACRASNLIPSESSLE